MEKIKYLASFVILVTLLLSCGDMKSVSKSNESLPSFTIKVTCNGSYDGHLGYTDKDNKFSSKSVDGTGDNSFTIQGRSVSCNFQKKTEQGSLTVEIKKNGESVKRETTTSPYGIVSLSY